MLGRDKPITALHSFLEMGINSVSIIAIGVLLRLTAGGFPLPLSSQSPYIPASSLPKIAHLSEHTRNN